MSDTSVGARWDARRAAKKGWRVGTEERSRCLECKGDAAPRVFYCSDSCRDASRGRIFRQYMDGKYGKGNW